MSRPGALLVGLVSTALIGCAERPSAALHPPQGARITSPTLLFDHRAGPFVADDFAYRPDWPTSPRAYDPGEAISYVEFTYDVEGRYGFDNDRTRRTFRSYRTGFVHW